MEAPAEVLNSIATLLMPYGIDFSAMWREHQDRKNETVNAEEWLNLKEAASFAKVSIWTVRRWCRKGVKSKKTSHARCGRILISKASLKDFIENLNDLNTLSK